MASRWTAAVALAACIGVAVGVGLGLARSPSVSAPRAAARTLAQHGQAHWAAGSKRAPGFVLQGSAGTPVSLSSQRGRIVLLTFLDSRCKRACPLEGRSLGDVQRALGGSGVRVSLLAVTVNPAGDTKRTINKFIREARWTLPWHWLGGSPDALRPVWREYGIDVKPVTGDIAHSVVLYVIDARGYLRIAYLFPFVPREVAQDLRSLAASA